MVCYFLLTLGGLLITAEVRLFDFGSWVMKYDATPPGSLGILTIGPLLQGVRKPKPVDMKRHHATILAEHR